MKKETKGQSPSGGLAKTGTERASEHAERMKKAGMVKVSVSAWVPKSQRERCRKAAKQAISDVLEKDIK